MDEEFDLIFENVTNLASVPSYLFVHDGFSIFFAFIGIMANVLIIYMIASNKKMKTNTNLILMNWAICNSLVLASAALNTQLMMRLLHVPINSPKVYCAIIDLDSVFFITSIGFVFALISSTDLQHSIKVNVINIAVFYATMFAVLIVSLITCASNVHFMFLPLVTVFLYLALFFMVLIKENICQCCGKAEPLSAEMSMRYNVARIYTYYSMFSVFCYILVELSESDFIRFTFKFFYLLGYICSVFVLVYLAYADKKFQICLINIFRNREDQYNVDATLGFSEEDCTEDDIEAVLRSTPNDLSENYTESNNKEVQINP